MSPPRPQFNYVTTKTSFSPSNVTFPRKPSLTYLFSLSSSFFYFEFGDFVSSTLCILLVLLWSVSSTRFHELWNYWRVGHLAGTQQIPMSPKLSLSRWAFFPQERVCRSCIKVSEGLSVTFRCAPALPLGVMLAKQADCLPKEETTPLSQSYGRAITFECTNVLHEISRYLHQFLCSGL